VVLGILGPRPTITLELIQLMCMVDAGEDDKLFYVAKQNSKQNSVLTIFSLKDSLVTAFKFLELSTKLL
jgi:hypothetical protein